MTTEDNSDRVKPGKPYAGFPLFAHNNGQWAKKVSGKLHYFGPWADPDASHKRYVNWRDYGDRDHGSGEADIDTLCQSFLQTKELQVERGERSQALWNDYKKACMRLAAHFGKNCLLSTVTPVKIEAFRATWPSTWAAKTVCNAVTRTSAIFAYAYDYGLVDVPIRYKVALSRPSARQMAIEKAAGTTKFFEAEEIKALAGNASPDLKAMIMLGVNCGFGGADCGRLNWSQIDLPKAWYRSTRSKTGQWREAWLWPETIEALSHCGREGDDLVFRTHTGKPYFVDGQNSQPLQIAFSRLCKRTKRIVANEDGSQTEGHYHKPGRGHYSLRHVFLTIADGAGDQTAMRIILGQKDPSISQHYRERIDPDRIRTVSGHVRDWYLGNP